VLALYAHDRLYDFIADRVDGFGPLIRLNPVFDGAGAGESARAEYESDEESVSGQRLGKMRDAPFDALDVSTEGVLNAEDFAARNKPMHTMLLHSISQSNEDWIWNNYFRVSIPWLQGHFALEANKTRLMRMDLPIHVFHGTEDAHLPFSGVEDLEQRFKSLGKKNLETHILPDHDHDLNYIDWLRTGDMPGGIQAIFDSAEALELDHRGPADGLPR